MGAARPILELLGADADVGNVVVTSAYDVLGEFHYTHGDSEVRQWFVVGRAI
jgi:hypothetical protein